MGYLNFDKTVQTNLERSLQKEMIRTNRSGGYNATTLVDCNTRKYHGQLVLPLPELSEKDEQQNVTLHCDSVFYESEGNIVTLVPGKLAVLHGMHDMIVAEQGNVLLICPKAQEQQIRQIVNDTTERFHGKYN